MQWLMRLTFVVWLVHFYVFDASMVDQRSIVFLAIPVVVLTLMTCLGIVLSIAKVAYTAKESEKAQLHIQPIAQCAFFAAILLISLFSLDQARQSLQGHISKLDQQTNLTLHPNLLKKLNTARSNQQGELFARMIYRSHGVVMPYQVNQQAIFFTPTAQDKQASTHNRKRLIAAQDQQNQAGDKLTELNYLFYTQMVMIFIFISLTLALIQAKKI